MLKQRFVADDGDIAVYEIMNDVVMFGEFIRSTEEQLEVDAIWHFDNYQRAMLLDESHWVSVCTGRATGKTVALETKLIFMAASNKYKGASENEILLVVQNKAQLDPVFLRVTQFFRRHPLLKFWVDRTSINFSQHEIKLLNGCLVRCRIVGSSADSNVIGLHVPCIMVDESQVFNWVAWNSLQQCLNSWDEEYQLWLSGVPNGLREKNVLFEADQMDDRFSRHHVTRLRSTRYTQEQNTRDLKQYGGEEGDDYVHLVLGEHGSPAFSVFDRKLMKIEDYPVTISTMNNLQLEHVGGKYYEFLSAPAIPMDIELNSDLITAGIDAGFSNDPTIIVIMWRHKDTGVWRFFSRYEFRRIKYPVQAQIINWLDNIYRFNMITIDNGSSGLALVQWLQESDDFAGKDFKKRVIPVDFQGGVIVGYDDEGKEIKDRVRKFTIQTLQKWTQNDHLLAFSSQDDDVIAELERVGFTRDMLGIPKYFVYSASGGSRGDDHMLASILTWVYGYYYNYYSPEKPKIHGKFSDLASGGWLVNR